MLTRMNLTNFQRHGELDVEFEDITTIVGPSDSGKSSIIRALRWVLLNQPRGSAEFIRHDEECVEVGIDIDGRRVIRSREKAKNTYMLDDEEFLAFGLKVPEPIEGVVAVTDLNFQEQHDGHFWLGLPDAEVCRQLNSIADLEIVDASMKKARKTRDDAKREVENWTARRDGMMTRVKELEWVEQAGADEQGIVAAQEVLTRWQERHDRLTAMKDRAWDLAKKITTGKERLRGMDRLTEGMGKVLESRRRVEILGDRIEALGTVAKVASRESPPSLAPEEEMLFRLNALKTKVVSLKSLLKRIQNAVKECRREAPPDLLHEQGLMTRLSDQRTPIERLKVLISRAVLQSNLLVDFQHQEREMAAEIEAHKPIPCPTCGQEYFPSIKEHDHGE